MNYKRYVIGLVCLYFISIIIVWLLAWFLPAEYYMDTEYVYWKQQKDYITSDGDQQEILLLGDSRIKTGIIVKELGDNVYNLSIGGATPIEMYYTLKIYMEHHPKPKSIIVAFGPMHFTEMSCYWDRNLYFHYLNRDMVHEVDEVLAANGELSKQSYPYLYRLPSIYTKQIIKNLLHPRTKKNMEVYKKAAESKGRLFFEYKEMTEVLSDESKENEFRLLLTLDYYMNQLLTLCKNEGIPVYIEQMPLGEDSYPIMSSNGYLDSYKEYMHSFAQKYKIPVEEVMPVFENKYFGDNSHLNEEGARIITKQWKMKYKDLFNN